MHPSRTMKPLSGLATRLIVTVILLPLGIAAVYLGGWIYLAVVALIMGLAAWEYLQLFWAGGLQPSRVLTLGGVLLLVLLRYLNGFATSPGALGLLALAAMAYHLFTYEAGRDQAASDFALTVAGLVYIGWLGAYFISLRELPNGLWWVMVVLPIVWFTDTGAYVVGHTLGRHQLSPRLSPKKTWEGYWGGAFFGALGGTLFGWIWQTSLGPATGITLLNGLILGLVISLLVPLGDLGESMIKRQVGKKDSGNLLPGHGGIFDRIDTWLWAAIIGYYLITWFMV